MVKNKVPNKSEMHLTKYFSMHEFEKLVMKISMQVTFGQIQEFNPSQESFTIYIERIKLFFVTNEVYRCQSSIV